MRTALYVRVSTQRQSQAQTIEHQLTRLRTHLEAQGEKLQSEWIFRDDGYSGATLNRHTALTGPRSYHTHQVIELPAIQMDVIHFVLQEAWCPLCAQWTKAQVPPENVPGASHPGRTGIGGAPVPRLGRLRGMGVGGTPAPVSYGHRPTNRRGVAGVVCAALPPYRPVSGSAR
jgi:hypothetical protein